jgi:16S rRNA (guanine966-N2)-methyltransferase
MPASAGRVIAGIAKGTRLVAPGEGTRPLSDRVKQTLFGILEAETLGPWPVPFLDLFAGSGAAGIEALSRGAPRVVFVEDDAGAVAVIRENLRRAASALRDGESDGRAGPRAHAEVVRADVLRYLERASAGDRFGAALVDPPYGDAAMLPALERLGQTDREWLTGDAVVVAKHFWRDALPDTIGALERRRERRFGETMLTFFGPVRER